MGLDAALIIRGSSVQYNSGSTHFPDSLTRRLLIPGKEASNDS